MGVALGVGKITADVSGSVDSLNTANTTVVANAVVTGVSAGIETTVVTYATGLTPTWITAMLCSGMEYGKFIYYEGVTAKIVLRGGSDRNVIFNINTPIKVPAATTISIKVTHFVTGETPDFEASILGYKGS